MIVAGLFGAIALTAGGFLGLRSAYGPSRTCDYIETAGGRACRENEICAVGVGGQGRCLLITQQNDAMAPPFPRDVPFACTQGPLAPPDRSHAWATDVWAVDLAPREDVAEAQVVSPIDGEVHVHDSCEERDASARAGYDSPCGATYGNHVRIWDGTDLVLLGHLARVEVADGERVRRGQRIGLAGASGKAGSRHVHLVVTRLRPGDHIGVLLGSPGHKGGVVTKGLLRVTGVDAATPEVRAFDALGCAEPPEQWWRAPAGE